MFKADYIQSQKSIGQLLTQTLYLYEDRSRLALDVAYSKLVPLDTVYRNLYLEPEQSNVFKNFDLPPKNRFKTLVDSLLSIIKPVDPFKLDWSMLTNGISDISGQAYLGHKVPVSLPDVIRDKLKPLEEQLTRDRLFLRENPCNYSYGKYAKIFSHVLSFPKSILSANENSDIEYQRNVDMAYTKLRQNLRMMFTDVLIIQYLDDFENSDGLYYGCQVKNLLSFCRGCVNEGVAYDELSEVLYL